MAVQRAFAADLFVGDWFLAGPDGVEEVLCVVGGAVDLLNVAGEVGFFSLVELVDADKFVILFPRATPEFEATAV